jgi:sulfate permease, SulP family
VRWFILEARAITQIDYSASLTIRDVAQELATQNVTFVISGLPPEVKRQFVGVASQNENRDGLTDLIGVERFFNHLEEALEVFN